VSRRASRTTAPNRCFGREIAERLASSQRDFLAGAAILPGGRWGPSLLSAAKNLAGTGVSAQILRCAQNDRLARISCRTLAARFPRHVLDLRPHSWYDGSAEGQWPSRAELRRSGQCR
jgi:hypothetical protein